MFAIATSCVFPTPRTKPTNSGELVAGVGVAVGVALALGTGVEVAPIVLVGTGVGVLVAVLTGTVVAVLVSVAVGVLVNVAEHSWGRARSHGNRAIVASPLYVEQLADSY